VVSRLAMRMRFDEEGAVYAMPYCWGSADFEQQLAKGRLKTDLCVFRPAHEGGALIASTN